MSLAVLTDDEIRLLLESMTLDEMELFRGALKEALHDYSNEIQSGDSSIHQPHRTVISSARTGATTLFMPSSSSAGVGIKVITLSPPGGDENKPKIKPVGAITLFGELGNPVGILHASTLTAFRTALASACLVSRRNRVQTLTVFGSGEQAYWHIRLALMMRGATIRHVNIINHRFSESCKQILARFYEVPAAVKEREGWRDAQFGILTPGYGEYKRLQREQIRAADVIFCCTPSMEPLFDHSILTNSEGRRKGRLLVAIGSYTPDMAEIPVELLHQATKSHHDHRHFHKHAPEGGVVVVDTLDGAMKEAGEIIEAGLSPQQLVELGELVMLHKIKMDEESSSDTGSFVSNDSSAPTPDVERLSLSSGPSMSTVYGSEEGGNGPASPSSATSPSHKSPSGFFHHRRKSSNGAQARQKKEKEDHLARWLQGGNVVYKSVGLGLMDLTVGMHLIKFAQEKGIGNHIAGF